MINNDSKVKGMLKNVVDTYKEIGIYLKENKWFIHFILMLIIEIIVFYVINAQADDHYVDYLNETEGKYPNLFTFIFIENLKVFTKIMLYGIVPCFLGSLIAAMLSIKSLITSLKLVTGLVPLKTILVCTVPHGLVEIPCMAACMVFGCLISKELTLTILKAVRKKDLVFMGKERRTIGIKKSLLFMVRSWMFLILPMTLGAAFIESYITPLIMNVCMI